jgi:(p)ppGpp synthase/HD superfamily hydrolase
MADSQVTTVHFVATGELKQQIEQWAKESDRTVSAELRQILLAEAARRQQAKGNKQN